VKAIVRVKLSMTVASLYEVLVRCPCGLSAELPTRHKVCRTWLTHATSAPLHWSSAIIRTLLVYDSVAVPVMCLHLHFARWE